MEQITSNTPSEVTVGSILRFALAAGLLIVIFKELILRESGIVFPESGSHVGLTTAIRWIATHGFIEIKPFSIMASEFANQSWNSPLSQDVFSMTAWGELIPKHSLLSLVIGVPLYVLLGEFSFDLTAVLAAIAIVSSLPVICQRWCGKPLYLPCFTLSMLGTTILFWGSDFNYELLGTACLVVGYALAERFQLLGPFVICLSILVRPSHALLAIPLSLSVGKLTRRKSAGIALGLGLVAATNSLVWGGPLTFAYDRIPSFVNGQVAILPHEKGGSLVELTSDWSRKLVGEHGLLPWHPLLILTLLFLLSGSGRRSSRDEQILVASLLFYCVYIFSYPMWDTSLFGNRFLFTADALSIPIVAVSIRRLLDARLHALTIPHETGPNLGRKI